MIAKTSNYFWRALRFHPVQAQYWQYTGRFAAVVAGRRSGKTDISRRKLILQLPIKKEWPNPIYFYVLPTFAQARRVVWYDLVSMIPESWLIKDGANKSELSFTTIFGSKLYIVGADKPHRLEGNPADGVVIDESSDQKPDLFQRTILPMLADREGFCYRIGVPKRSGIGRVEYRDFYNKGMEGNPNHRSFYWKSADVLPAEEIELLKSQMDPVEYAEQMEAVWQDIGSSVYYNFASLRNVSDEKSIPLLQYDPTLPIYVGCDFNVDPMCWTIGHFVDGKLYIFEELLLRNANTPGTLDFLFNRYANHLAGWFFYGDAAARARKTSATRSDYLTIKNDARFGQKKVYFPKRNPNVRDRIASVNRAFKNAKGDIHCYIHQRCKRLISDLQMVSFKEGTTDLEDYRGTDIGHTVDSFGYLVHSLMPIKLDRTVTPEVWST